MYVAIPNEPSKINMENVSLSWEKYLVYTGHAEKRQLFVDFYLSMMIPLLEKGFEWYNIS